MRVFIAPIICFLSVVCFAQADLLPGLKQQAETLLAQQKYDDLIDVGEKIVKLEKDLGPANAGNYMDSLLRVASWKRKRLVDRVPDSRSALAKNEHDIDEIEGDYQELISVATKANDSARLATAYLELARFYIGPRTQSNDEKIEKLLLKAVALRDTPSANQRFETIVAVGELAGLYYTMGDLERFYPLALRYIDSLETRTLTEKTELLPFLKIYADFLLTIDRKTEANEFSKQIAAIQGAPYGPYAGKYINRRSDPWPLKTFIRGSGKRSHEHDRQVLNSPTSSNKSKDKTSAKSANDSDDSEVKGPATRTEYRRLMIANHPRVVETKIVDNATQPNQTVSYLKTYVVVLIDETGKVVEAVPHSRIAVDAKFMDEMRERAFTWKFRPFVLNGQPQKMRATINITVWD